MRKTIVNTMFSTGAALIILAGFFVIYDLESIPVLTVFQIFTANIVINAGLFVTSKFESRYAIAEYILDISYIITVLVVFGAIFDWYSTVPIWALAVMAIVIYLFAIIISMNKLRKDTKKINELLKKRREKDTGTVS